MTGEDVYKDKAKDLAERLLPAFRTPTGIPMVSTFCEEREHIFGGCHLTRKLRFGHCPTVQSRP
jgi:hypothetical protein